MGRAIYFDAFSGISGDMTLGALIHAGLPLEYLKAELARLGLADAYNLKSRAFDRQGIVGIKLDVELIGLQNEHRNLSTIENLIETSGLSSSVKTRACTIFRRLAEAEGKIHGVPADAVHFHEVGAVDAIVDVVGACIGFDYFALEEFYCSPLPAGSGFAYSEHGLIPVPAPATLELLSAAGASFAPVVTLAGGIEYPARTEMVTPTGAAIVATLCRFQRPAFQPKIIGYGYGSKELPWPNALRIWIGETSQLQKDAPTSTHPQSKESQDHHFAEEQSNHTHPHFQHPHTHPHFKEQAVQQETPSEVSLLETNLDDMTPEGLGFLMERLLAEGALDVFFTSIQMKKNRPATLLSVLARPEDEAKLARLILRESSSFGLRVSSRQRYIAEREFSEVALPQGQVRVKHKILEGETVEVVPEYESVAALARQTERPWREIYDEAKRRANPKLDLSERL